MTSLSHSQQELLRQIESQRQRFQWSLDQTQAYQHTLDQTLRDLPRQVAQLRQAQYPYDPDLEEIHVLVDHWHRQRESLLKQVEHQGGQLQSTYRMVERFDPSSNQWLTESQVNAKLQGELRDLGDILAQTLRWQKQILTEMSPFTQKATALSRIVKTRLGAWEFLQSATFLCELPEVPMGAFAVICPHWGPAENVPVTLFISDQRIVLESQQTEGKRGQTRFGQYEAGRDRKLLQQWSIAALQQIDRQPSDPSESSSEPAQEQITLGFDESDPDVLVEQLQILCEAREAISLVDTLHRAQHPQSIPAPGSGTPAEETTVRSAADLGLSPAEIEQKIQKIEDALLEGRIGEQTYRELKQKYEGLA